MSSTTRVPLRAFSPNRIQPQSSNPNTKRRPLSCCGNVTCSDISEADSGFVTSSSRTYSEVSVTTFQETSFYKGQIFGVNINHQISNERIILRGSKRSKRSARKIRDSSYARAFSMSKDHMNNVHISEHSCHTMNNSTHKVNKFSEQRRGIDVLNTSAVSCPSDRSYSSDRIKVHGIQGKKPITPSSQISANLITSPKLKPWSPPAPVTKTSSNSLPRSHRFPRQDNVRTSARCNIATTDAPPTSINTSISSPKPPLYKPWSPPPAENYIKDTNEHFREQSQNSFSVKKSRKSKARRQIHNDENLTMKWDATSIDSGHGSDFSCTDACFDIESERMKMFSVSSSNKSDRHANEVNTVPIRDRVVVVSRNRKQSPVDIADRPRLPTPDTKKPRSRSIDSHIRSNQLSMPQIFEEIDLDATLVPGEIDSTPITPVKADNTYASLIGVRDTPPALNPPVLPPRDIERSPRSHIRVVVPTLKRSPRVRQSAFRPFVKLRRQNSDSLKRAFDLPKTEVTSKSLILQTKYHKYTIDDIVESYCNLVKDIKHEPVLCPTPPSQFSSTNQDISLDSGHDTLSQCSPQSVNGNEIMARISSTIKQSNRPQAVVRPRTVSLTRASRIDSDSDVYFKRDLELGEFYC